MYREVFHDCHNKQPTYPSPLVALPVQLVICRDPMEHGRRLRWPVIRTYLGSHTYFQHDHPCLPPGLPNPLLPRATPQSCERQSTSALASHCWRIDSSFDQQPSFVVSQGGCGIDFFNLFRTSLLPVCHVITLITLRRALDTSPGRKEAEHCLTPGNSPDCWDSSYSACPNPAYCHHRQRDPGPWQITFTHLHVYFCHASSSIDFHKHFQSSSSHCCFLLILPPIPLPLLP